MSELLFRLVQLGRLPFVAVGWLLGGGDDLLDDRDPLLPDEVHWLG